MSNIVLYHTSHLGKKHGWKGPKYYPAYQKCWMGWLFSYLPNRPQVMTTFKMKFLWRYGRKLCYTLELIQTLYAENDKENGKEFYNSVFPGEVKMCLVNMSFRAPSSALKQKNYHNSPNMSPIITKFHVLFKCYETPPFDYRFKIIKRVFSLL